MLKFGQLTKIIAKSPSWLSRIRHLKFEIWHKIFRLFFSPLVKWIRNLIMAPIFWEKISQSNLSSREIWRQYFGRNFLSPCFNWYPKIWKMVHDFGLLFSIWIRKSKNGANFLGENFLISGWRVSSRQKSYGATIFFNCTR